MWLGQRAVVGAFLLFCAGVTEASLLSDLARGVVAARLEELDIQKAPACKLSADEALAKSIELLSDGRQTEAEDLIKSAVKTYHDDVRILFAKAVLERSRWDRDAADIWFLFACNAKGNETLSRAAWISTQLDRHREPQKNLSELIRLSDENPSDIYLLWLGAIQCREQSKSGSPLSKPEKKRIALQGKARYRELLSHFALGPVMVHHTYANILTEDTGDYEEALKHRTIAISMAATSWTLEGFADTLTHMEKYRWACAVWAQAVRKNSSKPRYYDRWGDALCRLGRYNEAEDKYREAIRLKPMNGSYWCDLAVTLDQQGRYAECFKAYRRAVELGDEWATGGLAYCYCYGRGVKKDGEKAFRLLRRREKLDPDDPWLNSLLGICYRKGIGTETNLQKTIECFEKAKDEDPTICSRLGWYYAFGPDELKDSEKAFSRFEEALQRIPTNTVLLCNFSAFLSSDDTPATFQDFPRAAQLADQLLALAEAEEFCQTAAHAYFKVGRYEEAVKTQLRRIENYQKKHPDDAVPAEIAETLEKYRKALEESKETP